MSREESKGFFSKLCSDMIIKYDPNSSSCVELSEFVNTSQLEKVVYLVNLISRTHKLKTRRVVYKYYNSDKSLIFDTPILNNTEIAKYIDLIYCLNKINKLFALDDKTMSNLSLYKEEMEHLNDIYSRYSQAQIK